MNKQLHSVLMALLIFSFCDVYAQIISNTESQKISTIEKVSEPINTAFGIRLREKFEPSQVASILGQQPHRYTGKNRTKLEGTQYEVIPKDPDERFSRYKVNTTAEGLIYAIQAGYQYDIERAKGKKAGRIKQERTVRKTCKDAVKALADEFQQIYGEPSGKGWDGEWFSFRQTTDVSDIRLRLYANRCRTGFYSLELADEKVTRK